jgi:hypothetical protein
MLLSFAQTAGIDLGSNSMDLVPGNFEYLFEYARLLFSKLLQSHKQLTLSSGQSDDIHSRLDKDRDRGRDRDRDSVRDRNATSATKLELISSEIRDGDCDEHGDDSMGVKEGRLDEQYDFMFSEDDSRYIDDEISENKAVNESLLAAYLPILQGGSGSELTSGIGAGSGVGFVSKASDSDRSVRASILQTSPSFSSQQRQEQEQGAGAGASGRISMNGAGQYSQRSTRSNGEKRVGRLIPSDHYHPQQLRQQHQQQSHHRQQLQERDHTGSTDIEMSSTDFIRYLRTRRKDGSDPSNSSVQRDLFRSRNSDSTVASGCF